MGSESTGRRPRGRLIAFEGVDGAGKSTVLARVAGRLRGRGERVFLPRLGKEHSSRPTRMIRALTRDRRNLELRPRAELMLYCAREAQILDELVRPALARGETVLLDRSLLTPVVLGMARGLSRAECEHAATLAANGTAPDVTLVFDVHPRTSRLRKRIALVREHALGERERGRKGLAGSAFKHAVRTGYVEQAAAHHHPVLHAERATPEQMTRRAIAVIDAGEHWADALGESEADRTPQWIVREDQSIEQALAELPIEVALFLGNGLITARPLRAEAAAREPALSAWAMDPEDPLRPQLAEVEPEYALRQLTRKPLGGEEDLRLRLLPVAPAACVGALKHLTDAQSDALRAQYAEQEPDAVLSSLTGREDDIAWALRRRCWKAAGDKARASSLGFCDGEQAWILREKLLEKDPELGLGTLRGLAGERSDAWLRRYAALAPKRVLSALGGRNDEAAHALRKELFETGREVVDSVRGLADEVSFDLREAALPRWPSTVAHSLLGLESDPRTPQMLARCRALAGGDLHVLRRLKGVDERPAWPAWARTRASLLQDGAE